MLVAVPAEQGFGFKSSCVLLLEKAINAHVADCMFVSQPSLITVIHRFSHHKVDRCSLPLSHNVPVRIHWS
jgi:hypothetical protein